MGYTLDQDLNHLAIITRLTLPLIGLFTTGQSLAVLTLPLIGIFTTGQSLAVLTLPFIGIPLY